MISRQKTSKLLGNFVLLFASFLFRISKKKTKDKRRNTSSLKIRFSFCNIFFNFSSDEVEMNKTLLMQIFGVRKFYAPLFAPLCFHWESRSTRHLHLPSLKQPISVVKFVHDYTSVGSTNLCGKGQNLS